MAKVSKEKLRKLNILKRSESLYNNRIADIYSRLETGESTGKIIEEYKAETKLSEPTIRNLIVEANKIIEENSPKDLKYLIALHTDRYEQMYHKYRYLLNKEGFREKNPFLIVNGWFIAIRALIEKERLLGLHSKKFNIQSNLLIKKASKVPEITYDFSKLSFEEQLELKQLLDKSRNTELLIRPKQETIYQEAEVIEDDEIKVEDVVGKIKAEKEDKVKVKKKKSLDDIKAMLISKQKEKYQEMEDDLNSRKPKERGPTLIDLLIDESETE